MVLNVAFVIVKSWKVTFDLVNMLPRERKKRDFLQFCYVVANSHIGSFQSWQRRRHPCSVEHANANRLLPLGHWPKNVGGKSTVLCVKQ